MGPLSNGLVISRVTRNFVPLAANLYEIRKRRDAVGDFFRSMQKQKAQYQGIWIISPEGKVLAAHHNVKDEKRWTHEILDTIDVALRQTGPLEPREPQEFDILPYRGKRVRPDGSVTLALTARTIYQGRAQGGGAFDDVSFTAKQWAEFAPRKGEPGERWRVSRDVVRAFSRCLSGINDQTNMPRPHEVKQADLTAHVRTVRGGIARIDYQGNIAAVHQHPFEKGKFSTGAAQIEGVGLYNVARKEMQALYLYFDGTWRAIQPWDRDVNRLAAGVEWVREPQRERP